jgi:nitroreductase
MSKIEQNNWTFRQIYLALSNLLNACAELKIDACPMEGFEAKEYNNILGLSKINLNAAVIATIGYRSNKDQAQYRQKVRKPINQLFEVI